MRFFLLLSLLLLPAAVFAQEAFVPLTNIPALTEAGNASNLPVFLNNLYKICIGLAAVLAVLQLIRAGIMYMMGDSITEKKEAKNLIALAIMGLVLVLSPTIVFGIINKDILELNLDVKVLNVDMTPQGAVTTIPYTTDEACETAGGTVVKYGTEKKCEVKATSDAAQQNLACSNFDANSFKTVTAADSCRTISEEHAIAANSCCSIATGSSDKCCGVAKDTTDSIKPTPIDFTALGARHGTMGEWKFLGAIPADEKKFQDFQQMCTTAKGTLERKHTTDYHACSDAELGSKKDTYPYATCHPGQLVCK